VKRLWEDDELTAELTLEQNDHTLLANKAGPTHLGFAALLTFFRHKGRFRVVARVVGCGGFAISARWV
jgi:hypothetical protein